MLGQNVPSKSFTKLWFSGLAVHFIMLCFVLDLYFKSPVTHGMTTHKQDIPFAKRAVILIADGLRAEALYGTNEHRTPFLTKIRNGKSTWGTIHTRVPTESRPGHVAILAGLYEDPSAIFTGWQKNIVDFDSVINQSTNAWSYGSPDIVQIFKKHDETNHICESYDPNAEDFSGKVSTTFLDKWVFDKVQDLLHFDDNTCQGKYLLLKRAERIVNQQIENIEKERSKCLAINNDCVGSYCYVQEQICHTHGETQQMSFILEKYTIDKKIEELQLSPECEDISLECGPLWNFGNVFFLHLLGMDSAGHIHKPDSKEYLENLHVVDEGIARTYEEFQDYFGDNETVFIFTSDHGMTNWGSHGDGSDHETKVPYIIWGKGIQDNVKNYDMEQADLAPLISSLIGIPIPVNSVGNLHYKILDGNPKQVAQALFTNLKQIAEQYLVLKESYEKDVFYLEYAPFRSVNLLKSMSDIKDYFNQERMEDEIINSCTELLKQLRVAIKYTKDYYFYPKLICAMVGFIMWMVGLLASVFSNPPRPKVRFINKFEMIKNRIQRVSIFLTCITWLYFYYVGSDVMCYVYPVFPIIVLLSILEDKSVAYKIVTIPYNKNVYRILITYSIYIALIQLLVFGFSNKMYYGIIFILLSLWGQKFNSKTSTKTCWMISCLSLSFLLLLPTSTQFSYLGFVFGVVLWLCYYIKFIHSDMQNYINANFFKAGKLWNRLTYIPLTLFVLSALNTIFVAYTFDNEEGVYTISKYVSWILTVFAIISITISPTNIYGRFGQICACFMVPFTLTSINIDLLVYTIIVATLHLWISMEAYSFKIDLNFEQYDILYDITTLNKGSSSQDFRTTFFYLAIIIGYYFAIGNLASFNGFDPLWSRAYITTFNPIIMCMVIIFKMIIPFFIITCAFHTVNLITKRNTILTFTILLLYCDQMVLNFIFRIKNEGSWAQIGQSLSHFAIMEVMILVMSLFYALSYYVTKQKIWFHNKFEEVDMDAVFLNEYNKQQRKKRNSLGIDEIFENLYCQDQFRNDPEKQVVKKRSRATLDIDEIVSSSNVEPATLTYEFGMETDINQPSTSGTSGNQSGVNNSMLNRSSSTHSMKTRSQSHLSSVNVIPKEDTENQVADLSDEDSLSSTSRTSEGRRLGKKSRSMIIPSSSSRHSMTTRSKLRTSLSLTDASKIETVSSEITNAGHLQNVEVLIDEHDQPSSSTTSEYLTAPSSLVEIPSASSVYGTPQMTSGEAAAWNRLVEGNSVNVSLNEIPLRRANVQLHDIMRERSNVSMQESSSAADDVFVSTENTSNEFADDEFDEPEGVVMVDPRGSLEQLLGPQIMPELDDGFHILDRIEGMVPLEGGPSILHETPTGPPRVRKSRRLAGLTPEQLTTIKTLLDEEEKK